MRHNHCLRVLLCAVLFVLSVPVFAAKTGIKNLYRYTLKNGLELFVMENDAAPLAYIEIAVRAGAVTQTPETAGLFHLYEHMMFKGNAKYENQAAFKDAMNKLGVSDWNGTTGVDRVNYFFTIPSSLVREGLEFWSYAVRTPRMDEKELENEKGVVISEIGAKTSEPGSIVSSALFSTMFPEKPWQLDFSGIPKTVKKATVSQLKEIQETFYIPNNAALFVGGDVHHQEVYHLVEEIYGDWQKGKTPPAVTVPTKELFPGENAGRKLVYADPRSSGSYLQAGLYLRGPDGETDIQDTYAADVWSALLSNPNGFFAQSLIADSALAIPDPDYVGGGYLTRRASGTISLNAAMLNTDNPVAQAEHFFSRLQELCDAGFSDTTTFLTKEALAQAKRRKENLSVYDMESAEGTLSALSSIWSTCGADYFFSYGKKFEKTGISDIKDFAARYLAHRKGIQIVFVSPDVYQKHKEAFAQAGYTLITEDNAFWWQTGLSK